MEYQVTLTELQLQAIEEGSNALRMLAQLHNTDTESGLLQAGWDWGYSNILQELHRRTVKAGA